ncbi:hypothetical protein ACR2R6_17790 [Methylocaldum gracile subsp. desertum]|jgi:uncharacterized membrane protein|uniref:hypothetical protein n=1 Tax=Methylocaldum sp. GT1BW TaxID=3438964 RepID=UPI003D9FEFCF
MTYMVQRGFAGRSTRLLYIGMSVITTIFAFILALVLFVFLPRDNFETSARAKERSSSGVVVNATGIDNPAKAALPEKPESENE